MEKVNEGYNEEGSIFGDCPTPGDVFEPDDRGSLLVLRYRWGATGLRADI